MRISDWSSDVCSSDLGRNRGNEGGDGPRQQSEHDIGKATDNGGPVTPARIGMRVLAGAERGGDRGQVHRVAAEGRRQQREEIRSASGRDRVGKYVVSQEVSGVIQQKKMRND